MGAPKGSKPWNAGAGAGWIDRRGDRMISETVNRKRRQVREHRAIMERHLGRKLEPWEIVHHKDGDTLNNAISNLEVMDCGAHTVEHHAGTRKSYDARRAMEAAANLREEIKRLRCVNSELLEAAKYAISRDADSYSFTKLGIDVEEVLLAAIAKAEGR